MELYVKLVNQWGGILVRCAEHIDASRPYFDGRVTETVSPHGDCPCCAAEATRAEQAPIMREALLSGRIAYTRFRRGGVYAYRRDSSSPSGVLLDCSLDAARFDFLFAELVAAGLVKRSLSPLSPTEGMRMVYA